LRTMMNTRTLVNPWRFIASVSPVQSFTGTEVFSPAAVPH
jgi:hypothetical protein